MSIEEREDQLGALPEDRLEQQVLSPNEMGAGQDTGGIPADIQRQEGVESIPVLPDKLMSSGASVRSVYDARPINARDFMDTQSRTITIPFSDPGIQKVNFDFFIPGGYIGVLRGFHYEIEEPVATADRESVKVSVLVNDIIQLGYENLLLGQISKNLEPTFILAPLGGKLTLRLLVDEADYSAGGLSDLPIFIKMYGNLLLSQGVPLPFEIGNLGDIYPLGES